MQCVKRIFGAKLLYIVMVCITSCSLPPIYEDVSSSPISLSLTTHRKLDCCRKEGKGPMSRGLGQSRRRRRRSGQYHPVKGHHHQPSRGGAGSTGFLAVAPNNRERERAFPTVCVRLTSPPPKYILVYIVCLWLPGLELEVKKEGKGRK